MSALLDAVHSGLGQTNIVVVVGEPRPLIGCPDVVSSIPSFDPYLRRSVPSRCVLVCDQIDGSPVLPQGLRQANRLREITPSYRFLPAREPYHPAAGTRSPAAYCLVRTGGRLWDIQWNSAAPESYEMFIEPWRRGRDSNPR